MDWIVFINEVVFAAIEGLIYLLFFLILTDKKSLLKNRRLHSTCVVMLFCIFSYWSTTYLPMGINTIVHVIFTIMLLSVFTRTGLYASFVTYAIINVLVIFVEVLVILAEMLVLRIDVNMILEEPQYKLIANIVVRCVELTIAGGLFYRNRPVVNLNILKKDNIMIAFPLFQGFVLLLFLVSYISLQGEKVNMIIYNVLFFAVIAMLLIMSVIEYREKEKMGQIKNRLENQEQYVKNMEAVIDMIRKEKHDFVNHLNTVAGLCKLHKNDAWEKVDDYLRKLTDVYEESYTFYASGSDYVDGLLVVKSNFAHKHGITMDVDFDVRLSEAEIDDGSLISIVSNIIDNAFDALSSDETKKTKIISILSYSDAAGIYLSISNNGPQIPEKHLQKIFDNRFSTKLNKKERGYGLYIVKQVVRQNGGEVTVTSEHGHTEFLVRLPKKSEPQKIA